MGKNKIIIYHRHNNDLYEMICTINGTNIIKKEDILINAKGKSKISVILLTLNKIFVAHGDGDLYGLIIVKELTAKVTSSTEKILGIAKTSGQPGQTVEVVVPNFSEEEN